MKKIGIITHYYNSTNYGGVLQAYALCRRLNEAGVSAEQICYLPSPARVGAAKKVLRRCKKLISSCGRVFHARAEKQIGQRKKAFVAFREAIPHSAKVFSDDNIAQANDIYDAFVTGSDQVWHPSLFKKGYSLSFVTKPKFSYAASMAVEDIDDKTRAVYKEALSRYAAVSVRERNALRMLDFDSGIRLVADPVFLLTAEQWGELAGERLIKERYAFSYFLGDSASARAEAEKYAKAKGLRLVNIPYLLNSYRKCDKKFGDDRLSDVSPADFLSLIRNAECVFTDSFHVICFSALFCRDFYVFKRSSAANMNSRIVDILDTLDLGGRYVESIGEEGPIDYTAARPKLKELLGASEDFIQKMVGTVKDEQQ